jgi:lysophospholipase L1-like esterase
MSQTAGVDQSAPVDQQASGLTGTYLTSNSLLTSARALTSGFRDSQKPYQILIFSLRKSESSCRSASSGGMSMRYTRLAVFGVVVLVGSLLLSFWVTRDRAGAAPPIYSSVRLVQDRPGPDSTLLAAADTLRSCETRIEATARQAPVAAIVGASYTAGVGPDNPVQSWAVRLAQELRWNAVVYGVSGVGYARGGLGRTRSMSSLLEAEDLGRLDPELVIVQAGHDDEGVPAAVEASRVHAVISQIRAVAPHARIALLTTFSATANGTSALRATDRAIVSAAGAADPGAVIMDPLAGRWQFGHVHGGLHPTAAGDQWIARRVAAILAANGVRAARADGPSPTICDTAVRAVSARTA